MGSEAVKAFGLLIVLAVVAVLVSQRAQTNTIIQAIGTSTSGVIQSAVSPLTAKQGQ